MEWDTQVKEHYRKQAEELGSSKQSTMADFTIRNKEITELLTAIKKINPKFDSIPSILEIGCGNGYLAEQIEKELPNSVIGIDFSEDLLNIAKGRKLNRIQFKQGDATKLDFANNSFDIILTERCLINLDSWETQKKSLEEIWRVLRPNGFFVMVEAFTDGWKNTNEARNVVGLPPIPQPHHNVFFDKEEFIYFIKEKFDYIDLGQQHNFLSSYYFGSRVLYPSIIQGKEELQYNNKFIEFFGQFPAVGEYASIQMFILKKR